MSIQKRTFGSKHGKVGKGSEAAHRLLARRGKGSNRKKVSNRVTRLFFMFEAFSSFGVLSCFQLATLEVSKIYTALGRLEHVEKFQMISMDLCDCSI